MSLIPPGPLLIYPSATFAAVEGIIFQANTISDGVATLNQGVLQGLSTAPPTNPSDAATKSYVDTQVAGAGGNPGGPVGAVQFKDSTSHFGGDSSLSWTSTTGVLQLSGTLNANLINTTTLTSVLYSGTNITATGSISATSITSNYSSAINGSFNNILVGTTVITTGSIIGLSDLTLLSDGTAAANKNYVDSKIGSNPLGPNGAIQFNDNGIFGGNASLLWTTSTNTFSVDGDIIVTSSAFFNNVLDSSSITNGCAVFSGGVGISKNVNIGENCYAKEFFSTSDANLKENIKPLINCIDTLTQIETYSFNMKGSNTVSFGVIAQQLEEIGLSDLVKETSGFKSVNYTQFIALLIHSIKELKQELDIIKKVNAILLENSLSKKKDNSLMKSLINETTELTENDAKKYLSEVNNPVYVHNNASIDKKKIQRNTFENVVKNSPENTTKNATTDIFSPKISISIKPTDRKKLRNKDYKYCFKCNEWIILSNFKEEPTCIDGFLQNCRKCYSIES